MEKIIAQIETWNPVLMQAAIDDIQGTEKEMLLLERYKNILKLIKGKKLVDLINLPKKILKKESITKTRWKASEEDQLILQSLPITNIVIDYTIKKIPGWLEFLNLEKVITFRLSGWGKQTLTDLPSWMKNCINLESLSLFDVEFKKKTSLKDMIESFDKLTSLSLKIDAWVGAKIAPKAFKKLKDLSFSVLNTKLDEETIFQTSYELGEIDTLESLYIAGYSFSTIPLSWLQLTRLKSLSIEGPLTTKFFTSSSKELGSYPSMPSDFFSTEAVQSFLKTATKADEDRKEEDFIFDLLESNNSDKINRGLVLLDENPSLKLQAEERYLTVLKVLLKKEDATLKNLLDLKDTEQLTLLIQEFAFTNSEDLSSKFMLDYKTANDCLQIVDLLGALTQSAIDIENVLLVSASKKNEEDLSIYIEEQCLKLKTFWRKEMCKGLLSNGWLQKVLEKFNTAANFNAKVLSFNHTDFETANKSTVLAGFYFFILAHSYPYSPLYIDVAQSTQPDFTPVFWLNENIPHTNWLDVTPSFPASPLSFERVLEQE